MHDIDKTLLEQNDEDQEYESLGIGEFEDLGEFEGRAFSEEEELELASELLEITSDEELEQFLGNLIRRAARGVKKFASSGVGKALIGTLKGVAKKALPMAAGALGTMVGGPVGGMIGGKLGSMASGLFEVELEGLSPEDQELEVARRFVRFAGDSAVKSMKAAATRPAHVAVKIGVTSAARRHAPGLLRKGAAAGTASGSWRRMGNRIILYGV